MPELIYDYDNEEEKSFYKRISIVTIFILVTFSFIILRLFFLQLIQGEKYRTLSKNNRIRLARIPSARGIIYDRNRAVLTTTRPSYIATIVLEDAGTIDRELDLLSKILKIPASKLQKKIETGPFISPYKQIVLKKDLSFDEVAALEEYKLDLPGVNVEIDAVRSYPENKVASHILGYMGEISEKQLLDDKYEGARSGDKIGQFGLERTFNNYLTGQDGGKQIEVDAHGRERQVLGLKSPIPGDNLILTIDVRLQKFAEELLGDKAGAIVAINPQNGEVLAMVTNPAFNPNSFAAGISRQEWNDIIKNPLLPLQNRAIQSHYPPGSTFKTFVAIAGLETGVLDETSIFGCGGKIHIGQWSFQCWKKEGHGRIGLHRAIVQSCNVFFYQAGSRIGAEAIATYAKLFGLGEPTGICLENEESGFIPSPSWKKKVLRTKWYPGETLSMSIGQGYVSVTPLQLANSIAAVANGGTLYRPKLIRYILNSQGEIVQFFPPEIIRKIDLSPRNLKIVQQALFGVVNEGGTGARAMLPDFPDIKVAGKTGTAQVISLPDNKGKDEEDLPEQFKDHAWFYAYAPFDHPEIVLAILVEHGGKGGAACAPIAQKIFMKYFELKRGNMESQEDV